MKFKHLMYINEYKEIKQYKITKLIIQNTNIQVKL